MPMFSMPISQFILSGLVFAPNFTDPNLIHHKKIKIFRVLEHIVSFIESDIRQIQETMVLQILNLFYIFQSVWQLNGLKQ